MSICKSLSVADSINGTKCRSKTGANERLQRLNLDSSSALRSARQAAAKLRGKEQEVGLLELHEVANDRLQAWLSWGVFQEQPGSLQRPMMLRL